MDNMESIRPPPLKPRRVSSANSSVPEGAWQEEESLEVYRRKTSQRPPSDDSTEIVRFIKRHPRSGDELFETVPPRRDSRREIILLEPVHFKDHSPDTSYDDYALYRMEEYVDASSDIYSKQKEPVYYTFEKPTKLQHEKRTEEQEVTVEEQLWPAKEMETTTLIKKPYVDEQSDVAERVSIRSHPIATPTPFEASSYRPRLGIVGDTISEEVDTERAVDVEQSDRACSQCGKDEGSQTPLLDRTIYYEREFVGRTPEDSPMPTRPSYFVDDDIIDTNKKVDSVIQDRETQRSSHLSIPDLTEKRQEERSNLEEYRLLRKERSEFVEPPRAASERLDTTHTREPLVRTSRNSDHIVDYQKYEHSKYAPPSHSLSITRSSHTASNRSHHSPCCQHRKSSREHEKMLRQERRTIRDVPVRRETIHSPSSHEIPRAPQSADHKSRRHEFKSSYDDRHLPPIHEVITTEKFERVERIRRRIPGTLV